MTQHTNGRLAVIQTDFRDLKSKINVIHDKIAGNDGVYDEIKRIKANAEHLDLIPTIASNLRTQTYIMALMFGFLAMVVLVVIVKGTNLKLSIPGWLEINGNHQGVLQE